MLISLDDETYEKLAKAPNKSAMVRDALKGSKVDGLEEFRKYVGMRFDAIEEQLKPVEVNVPVSDKQDAFQKLKEQFGAKPDVVEPEVPPCCRKANSRCKHWYPDELTASWKNSNTGEMREFI